MKEDDGKSELWGYINGAKVDMASRIFSFSIRQRQIGRVKSHTK